MITDFSLRGIIKGCINSDKFDSPECKLLKRISNGEDIPEYPEYDPEKRYLIQISTREHKQSCVYGPTGYYAYHTMEELLENCIKWYDDYPSDIWEEK